MIAYLYAYCSAYWHSAYYVLFDIILHITYILFCILFCILFIFDIFCIFLKFHINFTVCSQKGVKTPLNMKNKRTSLTVTVWLGYINLDVHQKIPLSRLEPKTSDIKAWRSTNLSNCPMTTTEKFIFYTTIYILYILCILATYSAYYNLAYFAYFTYSAWKYLHQRFTVYWHYRLVLHPRAQLFTYHHLHPSPLFADLSHDAPGKSADSRRMAKGIVPVAPTGTRGRRLRMEDTGITYKTCACSRRS